MAIWPFRSQITEAAPAQTAPPSQGFAYGVPVGGTTEYNQGVTSASDDDRRTLMDQMYQAYLTCPWASACVDVVARTVTAGGIEVAWTGSDDGDDKAPDAPPEVLALRDLLDYVNPTEDIRQLMRGVLSDLQIFGDAFVEVAWVGNTPAALYSLDVPSMAIIADVHGTIQKYVQVTEQGQRAEFQPREVIHISLDTPRSGITGVSPVQKALLPITVWLFTAATLKEVMRKGDPPALHIDFGETPAPEVKRFRSQYAVENLGPRNIGTPLTTRGKATVNELKMYAVANYLSAKNQARDEIISTMGVPPSKVGIIESGNLGGGTGTSQDKTFRVNTCGPIAEAVLEKFSFHLLRQAFGISDEWALRFGELDWRDDKTIDDISEARVKSGRWTLNRARAEIGEAPVAGGDEAVLALTRVVLQWSDLDQYSKAAIIKNANGKLGIEAAAEDEAQSVREGWQSAFTQRLSQVRRELREADALSAPDDVLVPGDTTAVSPETEGEQGMTAAKAAALVAKEIG